MAKMKRVMAVAAVTAGLVCTGAGVASADDGGPTGSASYYSPNIVSGNVIEIPIHIGTDICGNTTSVVGVGNWVFNAACSTFS